MTSKHVPVSVQLPGYRAPAAGYEAPFEMLRACHERVQRTLSLLLRMHSHVAQQGGDEQAVQAARDVLRYFEQAAPQHHLDEERHVFPRILASGQADLIEVVHRLQRDHLEMEATWSKVRAELERLIEEGMRIPPDWVSRTQELFQRFAGLYERHIPDEEQWVFPAGERILTAEGLAAMAQDMMQRRGVHLG